jgi:hypothetical protein
MTMVASLGESPRKLTPQAAYLILLCSSPILIAFAILGKIWLGFGAWICSGLVMLVARTRWDLRMHVWFWITIVFGELLQIPIVLLIPWNERNLTWFAFLPVAVLDFGLVHGCVKLVEKMMTRNAGASSAN